MSTAWIIIIAVIAFAVLICFLLAVANFSYEKFMERYKELDKVYIKSNLMPYDFVNMINQEHFKGKLQIVQISQVARDAYGKGKLFLSTSTINNNSIASFTIIAHEMGHAQQDREGKLKSFNFMRKFGRVLGLFMTPLLLAGAIMVFIESLMIIGLVLLGIAVLIFLLALILKLVTISIEKDASKKGIVFLEEILDEVEMKRAKRFLKDARNTYWADFLKIVLFWTALSKKTQLFN